jgi:hypothetical protein
MMNEEKRKKLELVATAYQAIGLSEAESFIAAGLEHRLLDEDKAADLEKRLASW